MIRHKVYALFGICILLFSCGIRKKESGNPKLSYAQKLKFDQSYFEGAQHKIQGNYPKAIDFYQNALKTDPYSHAVMYQLGNLYFKTGQLSEATHWTEQAVKRNPKFNFWYSGQLAQIYNKLGQYDKAAEVFTRMITAEPWRKSNYIEASNQFLNLQKPKEAVKWLDEHEKQFGVDEEIVRRKESIYLKLGEYKKAISEVEKLMVLEPNAPKYIGLLAEIYLKSGQEDLAVEQYLKIIQLDSINGYANFGLADVYRRKSQFDKSYFHLKAGFKDSRVPIHTKLQVISSYYSLLKQDEKSREQAFELGEIIVLVHPENPLSYLMFGDLLLAVEDFKQARNYYHQSLKLDPADYRIWKKLFSISQQLPDPSFLEADALKALDFFPSQVELYILIGFTRLEMNRYESALEIAEEGLNFALEPETKKELNLIRAECHHMMGATEKSTDIYEVLVQNHPDDAQVLNNYAYFLAETEKRLELALGMSQKALLSEPNNASFLDTHGWIYFKMGDYTKAEKWLGRALESSSRQSGSTLEHYGDALYKLNRTDEALVYWKKAKEAGKTGKILEEKISKGTLND